MKINLFLSYKERTKHIIFLKILPNNQIITACRFELGVHEMTMNKKLTMIGLTVYAICNSLKRKSEGLFSVLQANEWKCCIKLGNKFLK